MKSGTWGRLESLVTWYLWRPRGRRNSSWETGEGRNGSVFGSTGGGPETSGVTRDLTSVEEGGVDGRWGSRRRSGNKKWKCFMGRRASRFVIKIYLG